MGSYASARLTRLTLSEWDACMIMYNVHGVGKAEAQPCNLSDEADNSGKDLVLE
jgi:hypothetical protein